MIRAVEPVANEFEFFVGVVGHGGSPARRESCAARDDECPSTSSPRDPICAKKSGHFTTENTESTEESGEVKAGKAKTWGGSVGSERKNWKKVVRFPFGSHGARTNAVIGGGGARRAVRKSRRFQGATVGVAILVPAVREPQAPSAKAPTEPVARNQCHRAVSGTPRNPLRQGARSLDRCHAFLLRWPPLVFTPFRESVPTHENSLSFGAVLRAWFHGRASAREGREHYLRGGVCAGPPGGRGAAGGACTVLGGGG